MLQRFHKFIEQQHIFAPHDKILVGVSGGVDSAVLLHLLGQANYEVGVAHCNFSLRGAESDGDEEFVHELCKKNELPFFSHRFKTEKYAETHNVSIQMSARALRYEWFEQVMLANGYDKVAVAHNLNDNVETFFINLTRGTGLNGLTGMAPLQGKVARPLLFASREEIVSYAQQHGINYREDSSNASTKYTRNYIRHRILPELCSINPSFVRSMQSNMGRLSEAQAVINRLAEELKERCTTQVGNMLHISIAALPGEQQNFWLYELLQGFNFSGAVVSDIAHSLDKISGKKFYSPTHVLVKDRNTLIVSPHENNFSNIVEILQGDVESGIEVSLPDNRLLQISVVIRDAIDFSLGNQVAFLDYEKLKFPLVLRRWHAGDYFVPFGMSGEKKLSDFFIDIKLNLLEKEQQLLLCSGNGNVAWILGRRPDNRYRVTPETQKILRVEVKS